MSTTTHQAPLSGVTVLDASRILSGPYCTMLLCDLGAEVIKIEQPVRGDTARHLGPLVGEQSAYFMSVNRGKKSVTLNIFHPEGQALFRKLACTVDVVVENYVPGTMERLGLDYQSLRQDNPSLLYASISGFGQTGPYAQRPALDIIVQAMGGILSVTGEPGGPPVRPGVSLGDSVAGMLTALAIVSALHARQRTGVGQYIDISMLDCQVTFMENVIARYLATGQSPQPMGSKHPAAAPFQAFATADGYIVVALLTDEPVLWQAFCQAMSLPELAEDPRLGKNRSRLEHYAYLEPLLAQAFSKKPSQVWLEQLTALGVPCGPVNTIAQVVQDPQVLHRNMVSSIPHQERGTWHVANTPFRFSQATAGASGPSPALGEHTDEVLKTRLGLLTEELARLRASGVI